MTIRPTALLEGVDDDPPITAIMSCDPVRVASTARLPTALHVMASTDVRHLPVRHG
jgi:hypothetical protein